MKTLNPDEVIEWIARLGYGVLGRSTLTQYARVGLIPSPEVRSLGRGRGVSSEYTLEAVAECVAAIMLTGGRYPREPNTELPPRAVTVADIARIRKQFYESVGSVPKGDVTWDELLLIEWLRYREDVLQRMHMSNVA